MGFGVVNLFGVDAVPIAGAGAVAAPVADYVVSDGFGPVLDVEVDLLANQATGPVFDHWLEGINPSSGPVFDHNADLIPGTVSGSIFDHNTDLIPGITTGPVFDHFAEEFIIFVPTKSVGAVFDHVTFVIPPPFTPLSPNSAVVSEQKIRGLLRPRQCVGSAGSYGAGSCGAEIGAHNVVNSV